MEPLPIRFGAGRDGSPWQRTTTGTGKRTLRYTIPVMGYGRYCARRMEGTRWWAWVEQLRIYRLTDDRRDLCFKEIKLHLMSRAVCCRGRHSIRCSREVRCAMPPRQVERSVEQARTKVLPGKRWWSPQGDGVARLKPELERVKEKHEIPNKTAAYFAKDFGFMRTRQDPLKMFTMCEAFEISRRA